MALGRSDVKNNNFFPSTNFTRGPRTRCAQYEEQWPIGSRRTDRLSRSTSHTGQRRSDVVRMAWTDVANNAINVVQANKTGARLTIPLHPHLSAILRAWPRKHVVMLTTVFGKPFSIAAYGDFGLAC